jgi:hypothetical protein
MRSATGQEAEGLRIAVELVDQLTALEGVRGVHLMGIDAATNLRRVVEDSSLAKIVGEAGDS